MQRLHHAKDLMKQQARQQSRMEQVKTNERHLTMPWLRMAYRVLGEPTVQC